jgi:hypothetical protein
MSTTQISESMNVVLKLWVSNHITIHQLVLHSDRIVRGIWQRDSDDDLRTMNETPQMYSNIKWRPMHASCTPERYFHYSRRKIKDSVLGFVHEIERDSLYHVRITSHPSYEN